MPPGESCTAVVAAKAARIVGAEQGIFNPKILTGLERVLEDCFLEKG